jgi:hypothetical protein
VARGVRLEDDRGLSDVAGKNVRGDGDPPGRDLGQVVRLLVVPAVHVIELDAVELVLQARTALQYASILSSWQLAFFMT